ncbi:MAG TPA: restriction endonuclease subunit S, partial [Legionellales bacterium]|nr:restriction endonuclease subunit S [Legionellales bacterium]
NFAHYNEHVQFKNIRINSGMVILRCENPSVSDEYLYAILCSSILSSQIERLSFGSAQPQLTVKGISTLNIPVPKDYKEQTAIAKALSDADAWIQSLTRLIAKKRQIKQGAMQTLLNPYENGRLKDGWEFIKFDDAFNFLSTASYSRAELNYNGELGYIHYGDIHTKWNEFLDFKHHIVPMIDLAKIKGYSLVKEGDLIMADASEDFSGIGKSVEIKSLGDRQVISGLHTLLLRDKGGNFVNGFRGYIHKFKYVKQQFDSLATGLKVYGLSKGNLKGIEIPVPPKKEQVGIVSYFHDLESEIRLLEIKLTKAKKIKQGMMQNLLTGRIRLI